VIPQQQGGDLVRPWFVASAEVRDALAFEKGRARPRAEVIAAYRKMLEDNGVSFTTKVQS
jgi:hypothetical protein